jgi:large subunit ribosomal protein L15
MPPRLQAARLAFSLLTISHKTPTAGPCIAPHLKQRSQHQHRCASILSSLSDNKGAYSKKIRRGRGPASGKGKTGGRGQKGQHAHGKVPAGFEGGQTPLDITKPERGRGKYNPCVPALSACLVGDAVKTRCYADATVASRWKCRPSTSTAYSRG